MEIMDGDCMKNRKTMKRAKINELNKAVYLWFIQQRCEGTPISGPLLMSKALQLYPLVYPNDTSPNTFKTGMGWLRDLRIGMGYEPYQCKVNLFLQL